MSGTFDESMVSRAIEIAMAGRGRVEPNPLVGCVLVKNGRVIGEGIHAQYGQPHAEPTALAACTEDPAGATAYVTLEPCCHLNKQTPPCAPRLIAAKVARVVVGCLDPNPDVDGKGVAMLRAAGIDVVVGVMESRAKQLIAPFIKRVKCAKPYVTLKWAQSGDGKIAGALGRRVKITNTTSDAVVHGLRGRCDAVAVGTNTVLADDPLLTVRAAGAPRTPVRVVLSNSLRLPTESRLVKTAQDVPTILFCSENVLRESDSAGALRDAGIEIVPLPAYETERGVSRFSFEDVLAELGRRRVMHLMVEPGPTLARALVERGQVDRIWVFRSPTAMNEVGAFDAPKVDYPATGSVDLGGDVLTEHLNPASTVFFELDQSADLRLARDVQS